MSELSRRRPPKKLSPETKWEIFLQVTAGEITQADAARKWTVDVSTIIGIRRTSYEPSATTIYTNFLTLPRWPARRAGRSRNATGNSKLLKRRSVR